MNSKSLKCLFVSIFFFPFFINTTFAAPPNAATLDSFILEYDPSELKGVFTGALGSPANKAPWGDNILSNLYVTWDASKHSRKGQKGIQEDKGHRVTFKKLLGKADRHIK